MDRLKLFRRLYVSTISAKPLLDRFWQVAMYDLEGESFNMWRNVRKEIEQNALRQKELLKQMFDDFLQTEEKLDFDDLSCLLEDFPELAIGNEEKLQNLIAVLPRESEGRKKLVRAADKIGLTL